MHLRWEKDAMACSVYNGHIGSHNLRAGMFSDTRHDTVRTEYVVQRPRRLGIGVIVACEVHRTYHEFL